MREPREGLLVPSEVAGRLEVAPHGIELHAGDVLEVRDSRDCWVRGSVEYVKHIGFYFRGSVVRPSGGVTADPWLEDLQRLGHLVRVP